MAAAAKRVDEVDQQIWMSIAEGERRRTLALYALWAVEASEAWAAAVAAHDADLQRHIRAALASAQRMDLDRPGYDETLDGEAPAHAGGHV